MLATLTVDLFLRLPPLLPCSISFSGAVVRFKILLPDLPRFLPRESILATLRCLGYISLSVRMSFLTIDNKVINFYSRKGCLYKLTNLVNYYNTNV